MGPMTAPPPHGEASVALELPAEAASVARARRAVGEIAHRAGASVDHVRLAVSEAVSNSVLHAFRDRQPGRIVVSARSHPERLVVVVADDGIGMTPNLHSDGLGAGLSLITQVAVDVHFDSSEQGTTVTMSFVTASQAR